MFHHKKADMAIPILIGAILAFVVLITVAVIFTSEAKSFSSNIDSCQAKLGKCVGTSECGKQGYTILSNTNCEKDNKVCCVQGVFAP